MCKTREHQDFPGKKYYSNYSTRCSERSTLLLHDRGFIRSKRSTLLMGKKSYVGVQMKTNLQKENFFFLFFKNEKRKEQEQIFTNA